MKNKESNIFFLWTYFGIDVDSIPAEILDAVINIAYSDATRRKSLDRSEMDENEIAEDKKKARNVVWFAIYNLNPDIDFSAWHEEVCRDLVNKTAFSYGNAQKLLNMTIKYLYLINSSGMIFTGENSDFRGWYDHRLKTFESQFHIPIDNYVLQYIYEDINVNNTHWGEAESIGIRKYHPQYKIKDYSNKCEYAWSKLPDYETYMMIQKAIASCYKSKNPLEWENKIWIEIAKKRQLSSNSSRGLILTDG